MNLSMKQEQNHGHRSLVGLQSMGSLGVGLD